MLIVSALLVWVSYDILLNLAREINCVWRRKLSGPTLLYLIIRYGTLVNLVFEVFQSGAMSVESKVLFVSCINFILGLIDFPLVSGLGSIRCTLE